MAEHVRKCDTYVRRNLFQAFGYFKQNNPPNIWGEIQQLINVDFTTPPIISTFNFKLK